MANVYIEPRPKGRPEGSHIDDYVVEDHADHALAKLGQLGDVRRDPSRSQLPKSAGPRQRRVIGRSPRVVALHIACAEFVLPIFQKLCACALYRRTSLRSSPNSDLSLYYPIYKATAALQGSSGEAFA